MQWSPFFFVCLLMASFSSHWCQEDGGGDEPTGGHDQPVPNQQKPHSDGNRGENEADGKKDGEQGYTQGFNQGVKPYSYGYNTGIKPYSYNFYQPLGGKPQVVEQTDPQTGTAAVGKDSPAGGHVSPSPPPIPPIEFPADFSAFGISPADLAIPPPPAQTGQAPTGQTTSGRKMSAIPVRFPSAMQARTPLPASGYSGPTPPPPAFNYADYGIPTDIGGATGSAAGSPFGILDGGGAQQQRAQRPVQPQVIEGDDFGIFGGNGGPGGNNGLSIPVLEDGNNQNNQQNLALPIFGGTGGGGGQNQGNDFNFANNDFNVAASDFEPFNFQNFVPPEFARPVPIGPAQPATSGAKLPSPTSETGTSQVPALSRSVVVMKETQSGAGQVKRPNAARPERVQSPAEERKAMYRAVAPEVKKKAKRSVNEQPHEKPLKEDPHSAWNILNMDPNYTNPNQGVYSYYPAYRMPS